jgi:DNA-binding response OmpR family regulator
MSHILLVTDDPATRASAQRVLIEAGYRVEVQSTSVRALKAVRRNPPAALMVDLALGADDCCDVVQACRKEVVADRRPILILAATPRAAIGAIRAGAQGCVKAPIDWSTLAPMLCQVHAAGPRGVFGRRLAA